MVMTAAVIRGIILGLPTAVKDILIRNSSVSSTSLSFTMVTFTHTLLSQTAPQFVVQSTFEIVVCVCVCVFVCAHTILKPSSQLLCKV